MTNGVFVHKFSMMSALGLTLASHRNAMLSATSGIHEKSFSFGNFHVGAINDEAFSSEINRNKIPIHFSRFEQLIIASITKALGDEIDNFIGSEIPLIIASTKGNINAIEEYVSSGNADVHLVESARKIQQYFRLRRRPIILSNACSSGLQALAMAYRLIGRGACDRAVVCGADELSEFTLRGFDCLHAYASGPCRPFDQERDGINLGEGAAAFLLSNVDAPIAISGVGVSNDANHISGPSRTGAGLQRAVKAAMASHRGDIDAIHAHGTATRYNDEMEAQAFHALGLHELPTTSMKGYVGHTLGASGALESGFAILSMQEEQTIASLGYRDHGVTLPLNVVRHSSKQPQNTILKTCSGFGGSNAAIIFTKSGANV